MGWGKEMQEGMRKMIGIATKDGEDACVQRNSCPFIVRRAALEGLRTFIALTLRENPTACGDQVMKRRTALDRV